MAYKKSKSDATAKRMARIIVAHLETLSPAQAKASRQEIHRLAIKSSGRATRGKVSRSVETGDLRPLSRASAESS